jgi:uroporphyrinogen-III decarboxylase
VRLHICGNTRRILDGIGRLGCDIVDLDFLAPISEARQAMGPEQILLGNIDPVRVLRDETPERVTRAVSECHRQAGDRFIVGPGCEVPRDTPPANLRALVDYARRTKPTEVRSRTGCRPPFEPPGRARRNGDRASGR